jgi:hypothetical protein
MATHQIVASHVKTEQKQATEARRKKDRSRHIACHHASWDKKDNCPENLHWLTGKEHYEYHKDHVEKAHRNLREGLSDPERRKAIIEDRRKAGRISQEKRPENRKNISAAITWARNNRIVLSERMKKTWGANHERMVAGIQERAKDPQVRKILSESKRAFWADKEKAAKSREAMREARASPAYRTKMREKQKKVWQKEDLLEKHREAVIQSWDSTERRALVSNQVRTRWSDPGYKKNMREKLKASWARRKAKVKNHKVTKVETIDLPEPVPVYCLNVPGTHNFALAAGIYVKNCPAFHYWGYKYIMTQLGASLSPENRPPDEKNPKRKGTVCKHLALVLRVLPFWWNDIASALAKAGYDKYTVKQRGTTTPQKKEPTRPQMPPRRTQQTARQPAKQTTRQRPQQTQIPQAKRTRKPVPSRKQTPVRAPKAGRRRESAIYTSNLLEELMKWESFQDIVSVMRNS